MGLRGRRKGAGPLMVMFAFGAAAGFIMALVGICTGIAISKIREEENK
ncbi:hypothetical protein SEA_SOSHI_67 [Streptomyces phage Soshi]|uniref:Uncharacterized protein n=1 Tax=Streptomyces phage Soshi TaxID=2601694 RepID=A0A5J6DA23_9CAUD|nr:hypothetical protein SEA_SOSHI_67 [Streptomyces phage Soshi]